MDSSLVTTMAALAGSVVGASASIVTTWISQRTQTIRASAEWKLREREVLYKEFVMEASRVAIDARMHSLEGFHQLAALWGVLNRVRLVSSDEVLRTAEKCCRRIVEHYWLPNLTMEQFHAVYEADEFDTLKEFSAACRTELLSLSAAL
jgi:hypothetical protein